MMGTHRRSRSTLLYAAGAVALLLACGGKRSSTSSGSDAGVAVEDVGTADGAASDATVRDTAPPEDAADTDPADTSDASVPDGSAPDTADVADASDGADTSPDAADAPPVDSDTEDVADPDATDTGPDVVDPPPEGMIKLLDPNAAPEAWYLNGAMGWSAAMTPDLFVVGSPEDNQRGAKAGAIVVGRRIGARWATERVVPSALQPGERFGTAVAISGERVLVGAPRNSDNAEDAGAAYVLEAQNGGWTITARFDARTPRANAAFGTSVAIDGTLAVIGAWSPESDRGFAELWSFDGTAWERVLVLESTSGAATDQFGRAVAMNANRIAIGDPGQATVSLYTAPFDAPPVVVTRGSVADSFGAALALDEDRLAVGAFSAVAPASAFGDRAGEVILYDLDPGMATERYSVSEPVVDGARFGYSVALDGGALVVGAYRADSPDGRSGIAFRYALAETEAVLTERLVPETLAGGDRFGFAVAAASGFSLVGAVEDSTLAESAGAVYLYDRSGELALPPRRLFAGASGAFSGFGTAVATDGTTIFVGAPRDDRDGADAGAVHVFARVGAGVRYEGRLAHPLATDGQAFGASLAVSDGWLVVGAPSDDELGDDVGAVYAFRDDGEDWVPAGRIRSPGPADDGDFGARVAISGTNVVIGAPARVDELGSGGVWLYRRGDGDVWVFVSRLDALERDLRPAPGAPADLGAAVVVSGPLALAGAPAQDAASGAVYLWSYTGGPPSTLPPTLLTDAPSGARFGSAVATNGGDILVGAEGLGHVYPLLPGGATSLPGVPIVSPEPNDRFGASLGFVSPSVLAVGAPAASVDGVVEAGRLWVYDAAFDGWSATPRTYAAPDATASLGLGEAIAAGGGILVAGAVGDDERGTDAGAAWVILAP